MHARISSQTYGAMTDEEILVLLTRLSWNGSLYLRPSKRVHYVLVLPEQDGIWEHLRVGRHYDENDGTQLCVYLLDDEDDRNYFRYREGYTALPITWRGSGWKKARRTL